MVKPAQFHKLLPVKHFATAFIILAVSGYVSASEISFNQEVQPLLEKYCYECHDSVDQKGGLDLEILTSERAFLEKHELLESIEWVVGEKEMPPRNAPQPSDEERELMVDWSIDSLMILRNAQPNDPGLVIVPRINTSEYDYVVRDLTGKNYELGQFLTTDGASGEGFLNAGANQSMTVGQFESFLSTAKKLLDYARITPQQGLTWFDVPQPAADRDELIEIMKTKWEDWLRFRLESFYRDESNRIKRTVNMDPLEAYAEVMWQYRYRHDLGMPNATMNELLEQYDTPLNPAVAEKLFAMMSGDRSFPTASRIIDNPIFQQWLARWNDLPSPPRGQMNFARDEIRELGEWRTLITDLPFNATRFTKMNIIPDANSQRQADRGAYYLGEAPMRLDLTKADSQYVYIVLAALYDGPEGDHAIVRDGVLTHKDGSKAPWEEVITEFNNKDNLRIRFGEASDGSKLEDNEVGVAGGNYIRFKIPSGYVRLDAQIIVHPDHEDTTSVKWTARDHEPNPMDYVAIDGTLVLGLEKLPGAKKAQRTMYQMNELHDRPRRVVERSAASTLLSEEAQSFFGWEGGDRFTNYKLYQMDGKAVYETASKSEQSEYQKIVSIMEALRKITDLSEQEMELAATDLITNTIERAWRRAAEPDEIDRLLSIYQHERDQGATYENAMKVPLTAILVSPDFLYRFTMSRNSPDPYYLRPQEIAERLSFALWGSLPDKELLDLANSGELADKEIIRQQVDRMILDPRADGFIKEFAGNWLHFAGFDKFSGPDGEKFSEFTPDLREAMYDEVIYFIRDMLHEDKSILEALHADYTFLNETLAKHYNIPNVKGNHMRKVKLDPEYNRGGILSMGAFLTKHSKPLRTSPIHRGIWLYQTVLGTKIPAPPPNVPLLSDEEVSQEGLTIPEQLAQHRADPACFSCHDRFDPMGVALESFDAIGRFRTQIESGIPVDDKGVFGDGETLAGIDDLRVYMMDRKDRFIENFAEKLLSYSLGRSVLPTDEQLIQTIINEMEKENFSMRRAIEVIAVSPQFLMRRDEQQQVSSILNN